MTVQTFAHGTLITLSKPLDSRAKALFLAHALVFGIEGLILADSVYYAPLSMGTLVLLAVVCGPLVASYRFGRSAMLQEKIFIDAKELVVMVKGIRTLKRQVFDLDAVSDFRFLDKPELAPHPLAGQCFDYFGFQTEQQLINEMYGDNRLAFDYDGRVVTFGNNTYSWEYDEVIRVLRSYGYRSDQAPKA